RGFLESRALAYERRTFQGRVEYRVAPSAKLPDGYGVGAILVIGDSRDLSEGEIVHLGHPLVRAAIQEAREATARPFAVALVAPNGDVPGLLLSLAGRHGRLVVTKVSYRGIEPVDHLLTTACLEGSEEPLGT